VLGVRKRDRTSADERRNSPSAGADSLSAGRPRRRDLPPADGAIRLRGPGGSRRRRRASRTAGRDRRLGRLAPGPQHPPASTRRNWTRCPRRTSRCSGSAESIGVDVVAPGRSWRNRRGCDKGARATPGCRLVAKIEKPAGGSTPRRRSFRAADLREWSRRGDLGIEPSDRGGPDPAEAPARAGPERLARALDHPPPKMLDSMVASSRPTRAEVADVANAILERNRRRVMLSQETAVGAYPVGTISR